MSEVDPYDTQSAVALLRQVMEWNHWYDRNKLNQKNIMNVQYISCMNPGSGSFFVNPRLQRHFVTFAVGFPAVASLLTIYETFLNGHLKNFEDSIKDLSKPIITATL